MKNEIEPTGAQFDIGAALAVAAADPALDPLEALAAVGDILATAQAAATLVAMVTADGCKAHRFKILGVEGATSSAGAPMNKARIRYEVPDSYKGGEHGDDKGWLDTDWLRDPQARVAAGIAKANVGNYCTVYQLNAPDPEGKVSQGFRRCVWVHGPAPYKSPAKTASEPEEGSGG